MRLTQSEGNHVERSDYPNGSKRWDGAKPDRRMQAGIGFFVPGILGGVTLAGPPLPHPPRVPGTAIQYNLYRYEPYRN